MTFKRLMRLLVTPLWIGGLGLIALGACLHVAALGQAPLTVVQPLGILAVPFSILLANRIYHARTPGRVWVSVGVTIVGIVAFTVLSALNAAHPVHPPHVTQLVAAGVVWGCALALALLAWRGPARLKCLAWAWAGAFLYGLGSGFIKLLTMTWGQWHHSGHLATFWLSAVGLLVSYGVGGWMIQQAYASGPAPIVVGVMTTVDPVVAVTFGLIVLGEGAHVTPLAAIGMIAAALVASYGVFSLSKHHPDARRHATGEPGVAPASAGAAVAHTVAGDPAQRND